MSLLLLLRNHQSGETPEPPAQTPRGGTVLYQRITRRHTVGRIKTFSTINAFGRVSFDFLDDDDETIQLLSED